MPETVTDRVQKRRQAMRDAGLRPVQIWVPDSRLPGFADACRKQSALAAQSDRLDQDLSGFMDAALEQTDGWE